MTLRRPRGHDKNKSGTMELGFVEKVRDPSELSSAFFPSKVGGKPEWLDLQNLPSPETLSCGHCKSPLVFLLQVYAPLSDGDDSTFHRTIFIFLCKDPKCHEQSGSRCFRVLRCQLPEANDFYRPSTGDNKPVTDPADQLERLQLNKTSSDDSAAPERDLSSHLFIDSGSSSTTDEMRAKSDLNSGATSSAAEPLNQLPPPPPLCVVCGVAGPKSCAKCKQAAYCSREHQIHDWKSGHKLFCADLAKGKSCCTDYDPSVGVTLPLFEIVTEPEPDVSSLEGQQERSVEERMADYHKYVSTQKLSECDVKKEPSHKESVKEKKSDKQFRAFKKRIALEPEQVIRYQRGSSPLLVSSEGVPIVGEIPSCSCGAKRVFEMQVMPQLLYYLKLDEVSGPSIDWGTLLVYTCSDSCSTGHAYKEEFLWRQQFSE